MSRSYSKQAKDWCKSYDIELKDTSTPFQYEVTLTAADGDVLWGTECKSLTIRQIRQKGSRKEPFWYQVACEASLGSMEESYALQPKLHASWDFDPELTTTK